MASSFPRLIADIGNTVARFAVVTVVDHKPEHVVQLQCANYPDFYSAVRAYLDMLGGIKIRHAAVAISNPVDSDLVRMVNFHWQFSIEDTRRRLDLETLLIVNDFTALAMALPHLNADQITQVGDGAADRHSVIGLVGPGTGLGVSGLVSVENGWVSLGAEGGHATFSPQDDTEVYLLQYARKKYGHVSSERLVSGPGIELTYRALCERAQIIADPIEVPEIARRALSKECTVCMETLDAFCGMLGTVAADVALMLGAHGGIYIGGHIPMRLGDYFATSPFRRRFETKGRFSGFLARIPTFVITTDTATFMGVSTILNNHLGKRLPRGSIIDQIRRLRAELTNSERLVADYALSKPQDLLESPISEIAKAIQVSEPTVIRFCRAIGCKGLSDFKLKLASGLTAAIPITHTQVTNSDSSLEYGLKVFGNTASAILEARNQLDRSVIDRAVDLLLRARRIEFFGVGNYGIVAQDAQYKFLRLGISTTAYTDTRLLTMAADAMTAQDVMVVFSGNGKVEELLAAVAKAAASGAAVIAITEGQSALSKQATVTIAVDPIEDPTTQIPMISRILHLLIIDTIVLGVALRRAEAGAPTEMGGAVRTAIEGEDPASSVQFTSHSQKNTKEATAG